MNRLDKTLLITVLLLGGILWLQHRWTIRLTEERDRFRMNSTALLSDVKRMRTDSATMALDAKALRLTIDEYEEFRAEDAETIRRLGVKIRNLEAAARHEVEVKAPIDAAVRDTLIVRDIQQQPVCGNQVFGIYKDRQKMMVDCKRWIGCVD